MFKRSLNLSLQQLFKRTYAAISHTTRVQSGSYLDLRQSQAKVLQLIAISH